MDLWGTDPISVPGFPSADEMPNPRARMRWCDSNKTNENGFKVQRGDIGELLGRNFLLKRSGTGCQRHFVCPILGGIRGQDGWDPGQPDLWLAVLPIAGGWN